MATLEMEVTLTNFNYSEDLEDPDSDTFHSFRDHFRQEVRTRGAQCPPPWPLRPSGVATVSPEGWPK